MIVIAGATATGKTELCIKLAKLLDGEVISADSMMVYKYMDIGTAKPSVEEREGIEHYVIDVVLPSQNYSVKDYIEDFDKAVQKIREKGKIPIVVGGTWLYIQGALYGLSDAPESDWTLREKLYSLVNLELYTQLQKVDPEYANKIHVNDKRRIVRALEVYYLTGKPFSFFINQHNFKSKRYNFLGFILERDRQELMDRIEIRVEKMFEKGLVEEVKKLVDMGFKDSLTSMQAIGYKEILPYLDKKISLEDAKKCIIENTKDFAKRQIRTFRNKTDFEKIEASKFEVNEMLDYIYRKYNQEVRDVSTR
ncbi:MAG TPA: tRNA (adenosine(37)-N6)-dimethylallyltransferase MiaA [Sulfurihydrogenibium sp.]|uniref:tRNA dimethylallyltransferase n=1 Tax=Sulfurihydrogenibium sp. (strain YO3AOP1) TaxID=436114 RepID=MIAA_SULSY|nr:tRNA (adenosine(37)-N6)-dimethylallyltransferase MiaA [Sulfurihydrogenibium sp. YO3AOP1]B2VAE4.1 RecName: Full=tRNA dimethylallyltransferase; AltName: Full=Dimethylallyl diphosphate:tRNA dimethylallyltransferase; Short=DMAPP:tRNA dimethylallyltransferase; Short=DMATase; AltName: Full=Isopentenyl-diphosphate:tRNA isopentenyltransferase; Short=IPP transferase; Short=IPPT; Short=IPTase [Sulfurihydrogenibium sp. YO3AOP1]ACD66917.1 tRNA delta(2)-isopentenylpyrophosphate transferase [Sulfurihydrogen